jgi:hypothetical protein
VGLPPDLFAGVPDAVVAAWRARAAVEYPSDLQDRARPLRLTLLAALCWCRTSELTDSLVDLLLGVVLKLNSRAERRVERELLGDLKRVQGKESILFRLAEAALEHPDGTVREALYPVVGEQTLRDLVSEAKRIRPRCGPGCGACCARRTPPTTDECWPRCSGRSTSGPTMGPTVR